MFTVVTYVSADRIVADTHAMRADNYHEARELTLSRMRGEQGPMLRRFSWIYVEDVEQKVRRLYELSTGPSLLKLLDFDWKVNVHAVIGGLEKSYPGLPLEILWKIDSGPLNIGRNFFIYRNDLLVRKTNNPEKGTKRMHFTLTAEDWQEKLAIINGMYREWPVRVWVAPELVEENTQLSNGLDELGFIPAQEQWNVQLRKEADQ